MPYQFTLIYPPNLTNSCYIAAKLGENWAGLAQLEEYQSTFASLVFGQTTYLGSVVLLTMDLSVISGGLPSWLFCCYFCPVFSVTFGFLLRFGLGRLSWISRRFHVLNPTYWSGRISTWHIISSVEASLVQSGHRQAVTHRIRYCARHWEKALGQTSSLSQEAWAILVFFCRSRTPRLKVRQTWPVIWSLAR